MFHSAFKKDTEKFALGNNNNLYICCCIWYNTWCWTHSVNWELVRMFLIWAWFLLLVLLSKSFFSMSVSAVEVYTTKISRSLFLQIIWQTLVFTEKNCCNKSRKSLSWNRLFEVPLFKFISFLNFSICNFIMMNTQWYKQRRYTSSCLLNLPFTVCFMLFLER